MGVMVYSLLMVVQDVDHQPYNLGFRGSSADRISDAPPPPCHSSPKSRIPGPCAKRNSCLAHSGSLGFIKN